MVAAIQRPARGAWRDDDFLPQLFSWMIALAVGAAWLLIVYLAPAPVEQPRPAAPAAPQIGFTPRAYVLPPLQPATGANAVPIAKDSRSPAHPSHSAFDAAEAFTAAAMVGAVAHISQFIPGALAVRDDGASHGAGKSALAANSLEPTPGMTQLSRGSGNGATLGAVQSRAAINRVDVRVHELPVVRAAPLGAQMADATEMGAFVRSRVAQLQTCYERAGGTDLAGVVALRLTIGANGTVRSADIVRRTWAGPGAAATEACLLDIVKGWRMPFAAEGATVTLPISFTRGT